MARVLRAYRIANPGKRKVKRKASPAQLAARAKFAAMVRAKHGRRRNGKKTSGSFYEVSTSTGSTYRGYNKAAARKKFTATKRSHKNDDVYLMKDNNVISRNPGEIITIGLNPGKVRKVRKVKNNMAKRRRKNPRRRVVARRRSNPIRRRRVAVRRHRRRSTPVVYARRRRSNPARRRRNPFFSRRRRVYRRRHNPSFGGIKTTGVMVAGLIGGAIITKKVVDILTGMFPQIGGGIMSGIVTAAVSTVLGYGVGKFAKSPQLGSGIAMGGYVLAGLQAANALIPGFSGFNPFGVSGMGMIMPSSFYTPQVPVSGSMTSFVTPSAVQAAMPVMKGMKGIGNVMTHPGRTRLTRVA